MTFGQKCSGWRIVKESFQEGALQIDAKAESQKKPTRHLQTMSRKEAWMRQSVCIEEEAEKIVRMWRTLNNFDLCPLDKGFSKTEKF